MQIALNITILIISILCLIKGASIFIAQASAIARKFKIPEFLIGITIVALGASLPELVISIIAATEGRSEITTSNILGSSIANIGFILAITAIFSKIKILKRNLLIDIPLAVLGVVAFIIILYFTEGTIGPIQGLILLAIFLAYFIFLFFESKKQKDRQIQGTVPNMSILLILVSLALIVLGGKYTVSSAIEISHLLNISEGFIGFTILALGSSLPELIISIIAIKKNEYEMSLGSIIGSNFFNLFLILGLSSFFTNLHFENHINELIVLMGYNIALVVASIIGKKYYISRREGIFLFLSYIALLVFMYTR